MSGDFNNGGSVRGGDVSISAQNIANTGEMRGTTLALSAREDLRNIGGALAATGDMSLTAGRDIVMETTTASGGMKVGNVTTKATVLDQVASLSAGGVMVMQAGRDVTLEAVKITQGGADGAGANGGVLISAGRDLTLSTVETSSSRDEIKNANNYKKESQRQDVGTVLQAEGDILLKAGQDITATAAQISSAQGAVTLDAKRDVQLLAGEANSVVEEMTQKTKKSLFKKKTVTTYKKTDETTAIGTSVSGDTVTILSGQDITLEAAQAVSDHGTQLVAGRDITIDGVTNSVDTEQFKKTVKSGLFSGGGLGVTIGKQELSQATKSRQETSQGSTVASVSGDVDITAGGKYVQIGSQVQAPTGNVSIEAKSIDILEARNQSAQDTETRFKQSGLSISLSVPGVDTALSAAKAAEHVTQTQDDRMKALAAATAISKANQALEEIKKFTAMEPADQKQSVRVSISVGSSQSKSSQHSESDQAAGSSVLAGGALSLTATGADKDSNVTVRGSTLAGQDVLIKADNAINLLAAQNTSEQHSKDSSSSASVGIGFSLGAKTNLGVTVSGSVSKGNSDGTDTSYSTTKVTGGSSVSLQSGGDTALQGAVVTAPKVTADVGGNLKIESLQDTAKFDSKSTSVGGSATFGYGAGGSVSFSQSKVNADYAAVGEQAGIRAGDGGFQVTVKGNTELKGGAITSSQAAIDAGKNSLSTGTLTSSDIDNRSQYSASAVTVSAGTSGGMAGAYKDSGDERSTTKSTISAGTTTITSGEASSQAALDKLDRGATNDATAGKLAQGWDGQELAQQAKVNAQIVAEFGAQASKEVGDYAASKTKAHDDAVLYLTLKEAESKLSKEQKEQLANMEANGKFTVESANKTLNDPQVKADYEAWKEGGPSRVALHGVVGALTGGVSGAAGAIASQSVVDEIGKQVREADIPDQLRNVLIAGAASAVGIAAGSTAGGVSAFNSTENNFLRHAQVAALKKELANCEAKVQGCSDDEQKAIVNRYVALSSQNIAAVQGCIKAGDVGCVQRLENDAAESGELTGVLPVGFGPQERSLQERQKNVVQEGSIHGTSSMMGSDVQLAKEVAAFRAEACNGLSSSACDAKVQEALTDRKLRAVVLSVASAGVERAGASGRKLVQNLLGSRQTPIPATHDDFEYTPPPSSGPKGDERGKSSAPPTSTPTQSVQDHFENDIPTLRASEKYVFERSGKASDTGMSLENNVAQFVKDESGPDFIASFDVKKSGGQGLDQAYAKMVNGKPQLVIGEAKASDSALTALGENKIETFNRNLLKLEQQINTSLSEGKIRDALLEQLITRTYEIELYVSDKNASRTPKRISDTLIDRMGQPVNRVIIFPSIIKKK